MLWVYSGDNKKCEVAKSKLLNTLRTKQPDALVYTISGENINQNILDELLQSQGMFSQKYIVIGHGLFEDEELQILIKENLERIGKSEHAFVFVENELKPELIKEIKKHAFKVEEFSVARKFTNDPFRIAEAVGNRDSKMLWKYFTEGMLNEIPAEEIHGKVFWQVKSMLLALKTKSPDEAGMKEYPYKKAKAFAKNYTKEELEKMLLDLVTIYHEAHRGGVDLNTSLEQWILKIK